MLITIFRQRRKNVKREGKRERRTGVEFTNISWPAFPYNNLKSSLFEHWNCQNSCSKTVGEIGKTGKDEERSFVAKKEFQPS